MATASSYVIIAGLLVGVPSLALTAEMRVVPQDAIAMDIVLVSGEIHPDDPQRFKDLTAGLDDAIIFLSGPGGYSDAGIELGRIIRGAGFLTTVGKGLECMSSCAYAWLGGIGRSMAHDAEIGFHGVYEYEDGKPVASRVGNALLGAYLAELGLGREAIEFISKAPPGKLQHLTPLEARRIGLELEIITPLDVAEERRKLDEMQDLGSVRKGGRP